MTYHSSIARHETLAVTSLAMIMACRMFGVFMLLPVFSLYAGKLPGATATSIGLALGIYGLTQACMQIPLGNWSDKIGRKPIIILGLFLFGLGSLIGAISHSMTGIIIARAIQGMGAIGSTLLATVADLTPDEKRSKSMAIMGLSIGLSFLIAMVASPIINGAFELSGLFWASVLLTGFNFILLFTTIPTPPKLITFENDASPPDRLKWVIKNPELLHLNFGIAALHTILTAMFIAIPWILLHQLQLSEHQQTWLYLVVLILSFLIMLPFLIFAEKKRKMKAVFIGSISLLLLTECIFLLTKTNLLGTTFILLLFFVAFNLLEANLPSWISKIAPIHFKGTAMGVYSTAQFLGIFIGGSLGGIIFHHFHFTGLFIFCAVVALMWLISAVRLPSPPYLSTIILPAPPIDDLTAILQRLKSLPGVTEVATIGIERAIYVKVDTQIVTVEALKNVATLNY